ncbi:MAG: sigma-54-dependent Fis family transcriptional regulator [Planctomycetes bacterium]|nr:sigma-54-dependent Fis family transcriptional regulator [Planctomycetota bacterium]
MKNSILIVDDEPGICDALSIFFNEKNFIAETAGNITAGLQFVNKRKFDAIICDFKLPDKTGLDFLKILKSSEIETPVIIITAYGEVENAVECVKAGAFHYVQKPFQTDALYNLVRKAIELTSLRLNARSNLTQEIVWGNSQQMQDLRAMIFKVAKSDSTCLITGETGSGKEMIARAIHSSSSRKDKPFIAVNCAALSETLLESEIFGHEKGAFTGADKSRVGRFELANGGTILLDEITETSLPFQGKLLRVLQEKKFERVGSSASIPVDVRIIATTNRNTDEEIKKGKFRQDLFFRLNVIPINIPPLREHPEDIPELITYFIKQLGKSNTAITKNAISLLQKYSWPGNIRELKNIIERAITLYSNSIDENMISPWLFSGSVTANDPDLYDKLVGIPLKDVESNLISSALKKFGGNREKAAKSLGITARTLYNKLKENT